MPTCNGATGNRLESQAPIISAIIDGLRQQRRILSPISQYDTSDIAVYIDTGAMTYTTHKPAYSQQQGLPSCRPNKPHRPLPTTPRSLEKKNKPPSLLMTHESVTAAVVSSSAQASSPTVPNSPSKKQRQRADRQGCSRTEMVLRRTPTTTSRNISSRQILSPQLPFP